MVDERESPSAGWREVYREMAADPDVEEPTRGCPDCGRTCEHVLRDVYECDEHGVFRPSASDGEEGDSSTAEYAERSPSDDPDEVENRASEPAD